jgi:hypothetical protein
MRQGIHLQCGGGLANCCKDNKHFPSWLVSFSCYNYHVMCKKIIGWLVFVMTAFSAVDSLQAQGTAFTYQGQLSSGENPASGSYDLTFSLYNSTSLASPIIAGPVTNSAVAVSSGLFTVQLNFGPGIFSGANYWLQVAVRTNGSGVFTTLSPRQPLLPAPYAIFANTASNLSGILPSTQLSGAVPSAQISGTYSGTVFFNNGANDFTGAFSGDGSSLNDLDAGNLTTGTVADERLSANVALLNTSQTFTGNNAFKGINNFTGVNTFTNLGNSFSGSFFGNGLIGWIPTNGTAIQAQTDHGYVLTNPQLVTVTLPAAASVGDIVRISGAGTGGWRIKENPGQSIIGNFASYSNSYQVSVQISTFANDYRDVAASIDGSRMYAVGNFNGIVASSDSGRTWNSVGTLAGFWQSIACSANGRIVYAVSTAGGIQKSVNNGATWSTVSGTATTSACTADGSKFFTGGIACSGNGTYLAKLTGGVITISTNGGSTFNVPVTAPAAGVTCLGVSSDCTRLVAGINNGLLYGSANVGATWTAITTTNQSLSGAWMSGGGSTFATAVSTAGSVTGGIYNYAVSVLPNVISTNSIVGSQTSAVELQFIGNGQFMPVSSAGTIWAN